MSDENAHQATQLFDEIADQLRRHMIFSDQEDADAITLWIGGTYLMDTWDIWPKLYIYSPERECGKTTLLTVIEAFVKKGQMAGSITPSALYRIIELSQPTICIDEADRFLNQNDELNGIINAGHTRRTARKILSQKNKEGNWEAVSLSLWAAQAIAGIGNQSDTLMSRSIKVALRRKSLSETVEKMDFKFFEQQKQVRHKLELWARDNSNVIADLEIVPPSICSDRAVDNWKPLFQIASSVGGHWLEKVKTAYKTIEDKRRDQDILSIGVELLRDIFLIIEKDAAPEIPCRVLKKALVGLPETEWSSQNKGREITDKWLANKLRGYEVRSRKRSSHNVYLMTDLQDAIRRYVPPHT
jgi:hypothetical protein